MKKKYEGMLTEQQVSDGLSRSIANAERLLEDAKLLFENLRFASAVVLATLSIEESGKAELLKSSPVANRGDQWKSWWKRFRDHKFKNRFWISAMMEDQDVNIAVALRAKVETFSTDHIHMGLLDEWKQRNTYVDFDDCRFHSPGENVNPSSFGLALVLIGAAANLLPEKGYAVRGGMAEDKPRLAEET